jgi:hypothetical protein
MIREKRLGTLVSLRKKNYTMIERNEWKRRIHEYQDEGMYCSRTVVKRFYSLGF